MVPTHIVLCFYFVCLRLVYTMYVASFSELSIFYWPLGILECLFINRNSISRPNKICCLQTCFRRFHVTMKIKSPFTRRRARYPNTPTQSHWNSTYYMIGEGQGPGLGLTLNGWRGLNRLMRPQPQSWQFDILCCNWVIVCHNKWFEINLLYYDSGIITLFTLA